MNLKPKSAPQRLLWAQFDALQMGSGWDEEDVTKPQILLEDVFGDSHPGSIGQVKDMGQSMGQNMGQLNGSPASSASSGLSKPHWCRQDCV